jgi:4'-phosphopantetheinyl transferase
MSSPPTGARLDLQVWCVELDVDAAALDAALPRLSADERTWADRLRQPAHRRQFVVTRAALRSVLGAALGAPPETVEIEADDRGKPRLVAGGLHFNLSHAGGLALIAVCADHPVGVDVEQVGRDVSELDDIARTYFSASEQSAYFALTPVDRMDAFYRVWTRKEAVAKALGLGMSLAGPSFDVSLSITAPRLLRLGDDATPAPWSLIDLDLAGPYVGAAAIQATGLSLGLRQFEGLAPA